MSPIWLSRTLNAKVSGAKMKQVTKSTAPRAMMNIVVLDFTGTLCGQIHGKTNKELIKID